MGYIRARSIYRLTTTNDKAIEIMNELERIRKKVM
jgi:hypothetical protein